MVDTPVLGYTNAFRFNLTNFSSTDALVQKYEQQNWVFADGIIASLISGVPTVWAVSTSYKLYAAVFDPQSGIRYTCIVPHISPSSGLFSQARALNPSYWIGLDASSIGINLVTTAKVLYVLESMIPGANAQLFASIPADPGDTLALSYSCPQFNLTGSLAAQIHALFPAVSVPSLVAASLLVTAI